MQQVSEEIYKLKYQLKDHNGNAIDKDINDTFKRVAKALASVEPNNKEKHFDDFLWAMENGALPGGRIIANAGTQRNTSLINCTVSGNIQDSMTDILDKLTQAGLTLKAGCGIGYCFSTLRPKNDVIRGSATVTSGALSFMDIYDKMCSTISSAGGRRGAQMATFDIGHPDIVEFIRAKRETGRLRHFNLSVLVTNEFIEKLKNGQNWELAFPIINGEQYSENQTIWRKFPKSEGYVLNDMGLTLCKVYKTIPAQELWDLIMRSTYEFSEPGIIFIDRVNELNNLSFMEDIYATNPCAEQPLPEYGSCLLGSINLTKFVNNAFTDLASFDWKLYKRVIRIFTRMLDNVVELNNLPLAKQQYKLKETRRHGMGYTGLGSVLTMLQINYDSKEAIEFTKEVTKILAVEGWNEGILLGAEKTPALIFNDKKNIALFNKSKYLNKAIFNSVHPALFNNGCRFTHHTSIAPTGTISLAFTDNASNGIEPSFSHQYSRNIIMPGKKTKTKSDVYSYEYLKYKELINANIAVDDLPDYFATATELSPYAHIDIQASAQEYIDSSISKTINVPSDFSFETFKKIYLYAYEKGLKGCTTFRYNPEAFQGVLVNNKDLENTYYEITLDDGKKMKVKATDKIKYDNEIHDANNLFDAIKEGSYGKY